MGIEPTTLGLWVQNLNAVPLLWGWNENCFPSNPTEELIGVQMIVVDSPNLPTIPTVNRGHPNWLHHSFSTSQTVWGSTKFPTNNVENQSQNLNSSASQEVNCNKNYFLSFGVHVRLEFHYCTVKMGHPHSWHIITLVKTLFIFYITRYWKV